MIYPTEPKKVSYKTSVFESPIRLGYTNGRVVINFTNDLLPAFPDIVSFQ